LTSPRGMTAGLVARGVDIGITCRFVQNCTLSRWWPLLAFVQAGLVRLSKLSGLCYPMTERLPVIEWVKAERPMAMIWYEQPGFIDRVLHLHHPFPGRSSVAFDLAASAPDHLHVEAYEVDKAEGTGIRACLRKWRGHHGCVQWSDTAPSRGTFDLWDLGAHVLIEDAASAGCDLRLLRNDDKHTNVGLICVRLVEADLAMARRLEASVLNTGWQFLILYDNHAASVMRSDFEALGSVVPVSFHFRASREGIDRSSSVTVRIPGLPGNQHTMRVTRVELTEPAIAEGADLWNWLEPRLKIDLITRDNR
jgi:hypothetical protein